MRHSFYKHKLNMLFFIGEDFAVVQQEIIMMKDCKHPNIVAYFGSYLRYNFYDVHKIRM